MIFDTSTYGVPTIIPQDQKEMGRIMTFLKSDDGQMVLFKSHRKLEVRGMLILFMREGKAGSRSTNLLEAMCKAAAKAP